VGGAVFTGIAYYGIDLDLWSKREAPFWLAGVAGSLALMAAIVSDTYEVHYYTPRRPDLFPPKDFKCYKSLCHMEKEQNLFIGLMVVHIIQL
jgi:hypothetical protein